MHLLKNYFELESTIVKYFFSSFLQHEVVEKSRTRFPLLYTYDPDQGFPTESTGMALCAPTRKWCILTASKAGASGSSFGGAFSVVLKVAY